MSIKGRIHSLESFGSADGPGVRFVVFFSGCNLRCRFCHNPDSWLIDSGKEYTAADILENACRYRRYWGKNGGITASGGEPLLQIDFLNELFSLAKQRGINTALDTAGEPFTIKEPFFTKWKKLMSVTDLVILDIKHIDEQQHIQMTGKSCQNILKMAKMLSDIGKPMWIRHVLVPTLNDDDKYLLELSCFLSTLQTVEKIEVLPYHTLGVFKWDNLGIKYTLSDVQPPSDERIKNAEHILNRPTLPVL